MSTLFAIKSHGVFIPVARRFGGKMVFIHDFTDKMSDNVKVWPLDNSAQGIYTLGDVRNAIKTGVICPQFNRPDES